MPEAWSLEHLQKIKPWGTQRQQEVIDCLLKHEGDRLAASEEMGVSLKRIRTLLYFAGKKAAQAGVGHTPGDLAPPGYHVRGVSQLLDKDNQPVLTWWKTAKDRDGDRLDALREVFADECSDFKNLIPPEPSPKQTVLEGDRLTIYPFGDPHFGMYAWGEESGEDWDLDKAEATLSQAMSDLVYLSPPTETAILANLGDALHADDSSNRTSRSGHALDVDTRYSKVVRVVVRTFVRAIRTALKKHRRVHVLNLIGNHDDHSALWLSVALDAMFSADPRVVVDTSPNPFRYYRFGSCLFGFVHGDGGKAKVRDLPEIMAADRAEDWGKTRHRHFYTGHVHHESVKERRAVTVETFRVLPPSDAWHHRTGYRSQRDMRCDIWHKDHGMVLRHRVGIDQLRDPSNVSGQDISESA